jgi:hypothetical protein
MAEHRLMTIPEDLPTPPRRVGLRSQLRTPRTERNGTAGNALRDGSIRQLLALRVAMNRSAIGY